MEKVTHLTSLEKPWGKSFTPKRYIHPPFSENLITMWPSAMIIIGETEGGANPQHCKPGKMHESKLPSAGMGFLYWDKFPEWKKAIYKTRNDGIPVHGILHQFPMLSMEIESFCSIERIPTAFTKVVLTNTSDSLLKDRIGMVFKTAPELDLIGAFEADGYDEPEPSVARWLLFPKWEKKDSCYTDGTYSLFMQLPEKVKFTYGGAFFNNIFFELAPGEKITLYFAFGRGNADENFSYEAEKEKAEAFWEAELSKIKVFPQKDDPYFYAMFRSLVSQGLQMFAYPQGCSYTLLRQGGLQRLLWPVDIRSMIRALARIGDFEKYIDAIFHTYFDVMQAENGEIVNFGIPWGAVTGGVLFSFGAVAMYNKNLYEKYKDKAFAAFKWLEGQRKISTENPDLASGLFPPTRASDYPADGQIWGHTDLWNLQGYILYAEGLRRQSDKNLEAVEAATEDYKACIKSVIDRAVEEQKEREFLSLPVDARPDPEIQKIMEKGVLSTNYELCAVNLGLLGDDTEAAKKIYKTRFGRDKEYENGLCAPFSTSVKAPMTGRRWYGSWMDMEVYYYYRRIGKNKEAKEILDAQLNFIMTPEYYMAERYDDHDPYYLPWCPNCSANGRTISMLCDWYIGKEW